MTAQPKQQIPTGFTIDVQPGPDGKQAVVLMLQCGSVTAAMAIPPDVADQWANQIPALMREAAQECRRKDRLPERSQNNGGLVTATADTLVHLTRANRRNPRR